MESATIPLEEEIAVLKATLLDATKIMTALTNERDALMQTVKDCVARIDAHEATEIRMSGEMVALRRSYRPVVNVTTNELYDTMAGNGGLMPAIEYLSKYYNGKSIHIVEKK